MRLNIVRMWVTVVTIIMTGVAAFGQTTYYVDPSGSDNNDGRSSSRAWRSISKVNSSRFSPGDQILFKRGGVWKEELVPSSSGTSAARITYGAYGTGSRPVITARDVISGWSTSSNWTSVGSNRWTMSLSRNPLRVWLSGQEYGDAGSRDAVNSRFRWNWTSGTLTVYSSSNPASAYSGIEGADVTGRHALSASGKHYLTFSEMEFRGGSQCIQWTDCDYGIFENCSISLDCGAWGMWIERGSDDGIIRYCTIDKGDTVMHQVEIMITGWQDNIQMRHASRWEIHNNYIANFGHDGINLYADENDHSPAVVSYNKIHHNEFTMRGDYGRAWETQARAAGHCSYNEFYGNYVHNVTETIQMQGDHNRYYYNLIDTMKLGPWRTHAYSCTAFSLDYYMGYNENNSIDNNTIRNIDGAAISVRGGASNASVRNNIIENTGLRGDVGNDGMKNVGLVIWAGGSGGTYTNNAIYNKSSQNTVVFLQDGWTYTNKITVADFNASNGKNNNVIANNISKDPLLQPDMRPAPNSPCIDAGTYVGLTADYSGTAVPANGKTDIGAFEVTRTLTGNPETERPADSGLPQEFSLGQNYPNPFNPSTTIDFSLPAAGEASLVIYNALGQEVARLVSGFVDAGRHSMQWNASGLASGVYFYRLMSGSFVQTMRMTLLK